MYFFIPIISHAVHVFYISSIVPTDDEIAALPHFRRDQLVLCKFLGSGAFGEVFEGLAKNILNESSGDTRCAVKVFVYKCFINIYIFAKACHICILKLVFTLHIIFSNPKKTIIGILQT